MRKAVLLLVILLFIPFSYAQVIDPLIDSTLQNHSTVKVRVVMRQDVQVHARSMRPESLTATPLTAQVLERHADEEDIKLRHRYQFDDAFSAEVTQEGLTQLKNDPDVASIEYVYPIHTTLIEASPLIRANQVWGMLSNTTNLTGLGETICVIDTGVAYNHSTFGSCSLSMLQNGTCPRVLGGYDFGSNDSDPYDVDSSTPGHGTNVAGILISNHSNYTGVAPGAKIVALKVFTDGGSGSSDSVDLAIDWCVTNASRFNISVISMSLGYGILSNTTCNGVVSSTTAAITRAIAANISVIVASGNDAKWGLDAPSCIDNVTSVGATYDANVGSVGYSVCSDSTTGADNYTCFTNRAGLLSLLAPGARLTSADQSGGFTSTLSGTSQATPMVAASFVIMRQFIRLQNGTIPSPALLKRVLNLTGYLINDTARTGLNFSRINLAAAIRYLDATPPTITLVYPADQGKVRGNFSFNFTVGDVSPIVNASLYTTFLGPSNFTFNTTSLTLTSGNVSSIVVFNVSDGIYTWNILACDNQSRCAFASANLTVWVDSTPPVITIEGPNTSHLLNSSPMILRYNTTDTQGILDSCSLFLNGVLNQTNESMLPGPGKSFVVQNATDGIYSWSVNCSDNSANKGNSTLATFFYDVTAPNITLVSPTNNSYSSSQYILFNYTLSDFSGLMNATLYANFSGTYATNISNITLLTSGGSFAFNVSGLHDGRYVWSVQACDNVTASHCGFASYNLTLTVDTTAPTISFVTPTTPTNDTFTKNQTLAILVSINDSSIANSTFDIYNGSSGALYNTTFSPGFEGTSSVQGSGITLPDGLYLYNVTTTDSAGTRASTPTRRLSIDTQKPNAQSAVVVSGTNRSNQTSTFNATWEDPIGLSGGLSGYIFSHNQSGTFVNLSWTAFSANNYSTALLNITRPRGTLIAYLFFANDSAGNFNQTPLDTLTVLNTPPNVSTITSPANLSYSSSGVIVASATDADNDTLTYFYYINGSLNATSTSNVTINGSDGLYFVEVLASDSFENASVNSTGMLFTLDRTAPQVNFTQGTDLDNSFSNSKLWIFVNMSLSDANFARALFVLLNESGFVNQTNITDGNRSLNYTGLPLNAVYRFNVTVYDLANNSNYTQERNVTFDTLIPAIGSRSESISSTSAVISFSSGESVSGNVTYGTSQSLGSSSIDSAPRPSKSITLSSLSASITYYYNITACDQAFNCNTTGPFNFTTPAQSSGSSGGGGGGGGGGSGGSGVGSSSSSSSDSQTHVVSFAVEKTKTIEPSIQDFPVSKIDVTTIASGSASFTFEKLKAKPNGTPAIDEETASFISIAKSLQDSQVVSVNISFTVNKSWLQGKGLKPSDVHLLRLTNLWNPLPTQMTGENSTVVSFRANSPGLSYFAIAAKRPAPIAAKPSAENQTATPPQPAEPEQAPEKATPIVAPKKPLPKWMVPMIIALFISVAAILILSRSVGPLLASHRHPSPRSGISSSLREAELEEYVRNTRAQGYSIPDIKAALLKKGWQQEAVDKALFKATISKVDSTFSSYDVPAKKQGAAKLESYILSMTAQTLSRPEIARRLRNQGWSQGDIDQAFSQLSDGKQP